MKICHRSADFLKLQLKKMILTPKMELKSFFIVHFIGKTGFEPATPWSQTKCSTKLSYFPWV
ncbi:conserved hypothetical protein [Carnobacterium maltaromaticum]|nr:conserved hypothetical protein [Carnobacterium maltaromaticum]